MSVAQVFVRSVTWIRSPPSDEEGKIQLTGNPTVFCTTSYDGSLYVTDIREMSSYSVFRARGEFVLL